MFEEPRRLNMGGKKRGLAAVVVLVMLVTAGVALAKTEKVKKKNQSAYAGWGVKDEYQKLFKANSIETFSGTVNAVINIRPNPDMKMGSQLFLQLDPEAPKEGEETQEAKKDPKGKKEKATKPKKVIYPVHLGPKVWVKKHNNFIKYGDRVEVTGSKILYKKTPILIATQVKKGDKVLVLRSEKGIPVWTLPAKVEKKPEKAPEAPESK
jgi:hypothetical protein